MARQDKAATQRRYAEEDLLAILVGMEFDLRELEVRIAQAMRRSELVRPVLEPALERVEQMRIAVTAAHDARRRAGAGSKSVVE